jgi:hypothetical protein
VLCGGRDFGPVWFVAHTSPAKKLAAYYILVYAWFVAKILTANGYPSISLTDSCQIFDQVWAEDSLAKFLASQFLPTFGRARPGHEPNMPLVQRRAFKVQHEINLI